MNSGLRVRFLNEGGKHVAVAVSGYLTGNTAMTLLSVNSLNPRPKSLYLTEVTFAIQEKLGLNLFWGMQGEKESELILPMESKGRFDFSAHRGLPPPKEGWDGTIILSAFNFELPPQAERKHLMLILHLEKGNG